MTRSMATVARLVVMGAVAGASEAFVCREPKCPEKQGICVVADAHDRCTQGPFSLSHV